MATALANAVETIDPRRLARTTGGGAGSLAARAAPWLGWAGMAGQALWDGIPAYRAARAQGEPRSRASAIGTIEAMKGATMYDAWGGPATEESARQLFEHGRSDQFP